MIQIKTYSAILLLFVFSMSVFGQEETTESNEKTQLVLRAHAKKDAIYLRWGVNDAFAWKYGITYGYIIERATVFRDGKPLKEAEKIILTGAAIKPKPMAEWETLVERNDMAAIAAQAIYGEDFITDDQDENVVMRVMNQSSELEQRFGFSMFAIDQNFEAAQYAGFGFIDKNVKTNERYLYNIKMAVPEELLKIEETGLLIAPSELNVLPKPYDFAGYYYNNAFVLIWEYDALVNFYTAYDLEKSEDGMNFSKINKTPITKLADTKVSGISYTDSIPTYGKKYWYRIIGRTIFDEKSKPSDTISVIAYKELLVAPELKENEIISDKEVVLKWGFASDEAWKLTGFDVLRAEKPTGPYAVIKEKLESKARSYRYNDVKDINYFKIRAHGIAGDYQDSSPNMIQPIDSIPPAIPKGLVGKVDTLGIVKLSWEKNVELDLRGYAIFRADSPNQEFTRLNKQELTDIDYTDTINLKSFNKKVYYKLAALDNRYNESKASIILELERPSKIPPTSPVFKTYEVVGDNIHLNWINSSSENVTKQIIYRKTIGKDTGQLWENVYETQDTTISEYKDGNTIPDTKYLYTIVAVNAVGIESKPSPPLSVITTAELVKPEIKGLFSTVDRENKFIQLSWRYSEPDVFEIQLFRKAGKEGTNTLYQTFAPDKKQFIDTQLIPNTIYTYGFKAVFNDGSVSKWNEIQVTY